MSIYYYFVPLWRLSSWHVIYELLWILRVPTFSLYLLLHWFHLLSEFWVARWWIYRFLKWLSLTCCSYTLLNFFHVVRLIDLISKLGLQKGSVLRHMSSVIQPILEKGIVDHSIIHRALMEYLSIADKVFILN